LEETFRGRFQNSRNPGSQCISSRIDEAAKRWTSAGENVKREFLQVVDKGLEAGSGRKWHSCPGCRKITLWWGAENGFKTNRPADESGTLH
jgi:hypothetical protein